ALLLIHHSFRPGPHRAGRGLRHENAVGHRQIRAGVTVEDELAAHHRRVHPCGGRRLPDRNSVNACATVAEMVIPDRVALARTEAASDAGSLTVNTTLACGTSRRPAAVAWSR